MWLCQAGPLCLSPRWARTSISSVAKQARGWRPLGGTHRAPAVLLVMGRALRDWSPCAHLTTPVAPSPPCECSPLPIPCPCSWGAHVQTSLSPPGWGVQWGWPPVPAHGHPEHTGTALQGRTPAAERHTKPFWWHRGSGEQEEEEEARKARLPAPACPTQPLPADRTRSDSGWIFTIQKLRPCPNPPASASTHLPLRAPGLGPRVHFHPR